jgi:hypothetical protein
MLYYITIDGYPSMPYLKGLDEVTILDLKDTSLHLNANDFINTDGNH